MNVTNKIDNNTVSRTQLSNHTYMKINSERELNKYEVCVRKVFNTNKDGLFNRAWSTLDPITNINNVDINRFPIYVRYDDIFNVIDIFREKPSDNIILNRGKKLY